MRSQKNIKTALNTYIKTHGVKAVFIAKRCEIDASLLCKFRKGEKELWDETLDKIVMFLNEQGVKVK